MKLLQLKLQIIFYILVIAGENNSKIIININPNINPILFYYSDCLYETKFKYNMKISEL